MRLRKGQQPSDFSRMLTTSLPSSTSTEDRRVLGEHILNALMGERAPDWEFIDCFCTSVAALHQPPEPRMQLGYFGSTGLLTRIDRVKKYVPKGYDINVNSYRVYHLQAQRVNALTRLSNSVSVWEGSNSQPSGVHTGPHLVVHANGVHACYEHMVSQIRGLGIVPEVVLQIIKGYYMWFTWEVYASSVRNKIDCLFKPAFEDVSFHWWLFENDQNENA